LLVGGVAGAALGALARSRVFGLIGLVASLTGIAILLRGRLDQREERILSAEERIRSELDGLDPIARARVLKDLANSQLSSE
jgi:hypothetical protein